jgi:hypothetical protein
MLVAANFSNKTIGQCQQRWLFLSNFQTRNPQPIKHINSDEAAKLRQMEEAGKLRLFILNLENGFRPPVPLTSQTNVNNVTRSPVSKPINDYLIEEVLNKN